MKNALQAMVITPQKLIEVKTPLPKTWKQAAGVLKGKNKVDSLDYQNKIREEWGDLQR